MRYKVWRKHPGGPREVRLFVMIVADPPEGPDTNWTAHVPEVIRTVGFWVGGIEGQVENLKPVYREMLKRHGFVVFGDLPTHKMLEDKIAPEP